MNNDLYVNVGELENLIDYIGKRNPSVKEVTQEIIEVMYDLDWVEIEPSEVNIVPGAKKKKYKRHEMCQRIKTLFENSGKTYMELSKILNIPRSGIYSYIDEEHVPGAENIAAICKEFNITSDYLIFGE